MLLLYYAALLPRRGPHIASHSVCLSVFPSVPCLFTVEHRSRVFVNLADVRYLLFCLHARAAYSTAISAARACSTKFRVNQILIRQDIAKRRFSIWWPSAILNLKNFGILLSNRPWKHNLYLHTKFRWNRMISGWDITIKVFSKWRPSAILNFRNSVFWSYGLC